jgi:hypothetical protein
MMKTPAFLRVGLARCEFLDQRNQGPRDQKPDHTANQHRPVLHTSLNRKMTTTLEGVCCARYGARIWIHAASRSIAGVAVTSG